MWVAPIHGMCNVMRAGRFTSFGMAARRNAGPKTFVRTLLPAGRPKLRTDSSLDEPDEGPWCAVDRSVDVLARCFFPLE